MKKSCNVSILCLRVLHLQSLRYLIKLYQAVSQAGLSYDFLQLQSDGRWVFREQVTGGIAGKRFQFPLCAL